MARSTKHKRPHTPQGDRAIKDLVSRFNLEVRRRGLDKDPERLYNSSFFDMVDPSVMIHCIIELQIAYNKLRDRCECLENTMLAEAE